MKIKTNKKNNLLKIKIEKNKIKSELEDFMSNGKYEPFILDVNMQGFCENLQYSIWPSVLSDSKPYDIEEEVSAKEIIEINYDSMVEWIIENIEEESHINRFSTNIKITT